MKKIIEYVIMGATVLLVMAICVSLDMNGTLSGVLAFIAMIIAFIAFEIAYGQYHMKKEKILSQHMTINETDESATLFQRSEISASLLKMEPIYTTNTKHHDAKLVYTGATVGGVHTGGFHTTKAYLSDTYTGTSGKYHIFVKQDNGKVVEIKKIKLTKQLLSEAKHSPSIRKFIVNNEISLRYDNDETKLTKEEQYILKEAVNNYDKATQYNITQRAFLATQLTQEDCNAIINWVSGN